MSDVSMSTRLAVPAQQVWQLIGGWNAVADWHPGVEKSELEGGGEVRRLSIAGGGTFVEKLVHHDDGSRSYSYEIVDSPLPVANYRATITVGEDPEGCKVTWSSNFDPAGASETDAAAMVRGIYEMGFKNLQRLFGTSDK